MCVCVSVCVCACACVCVCVCVCVCGACLSVCVCVCSVDSVGISETVHLLTHTLSFERYSESTSHPDTNDDKCDPLFCRSAHVTVISEKRSCDSLLICLSPHRLYSGH